MMQRIGPEHVGKDTYRIIEATMMNNAKRIVGYNWYQAAYPNGTVPTRTEMRDYGRECALAYILEGDTYDQALRKATKHMYHRCYDDARNYIKYVGGNRDRVQAVTSLVETNTGDGTGIAAARSRQAFTENPTTWHVDDHHWFETCDMITRLPIPDLDKQVLTLIAAGYKHREIGETLGIKRTTITMMVPRIAERIRTCLGAGNSNLGTSWRMTLESSVS
jgi:hypothetical protein